jgi:hypothetical protein
MANIPLADLQAQMINYLTHSDMTISQHIVEQGNITKDVRLHIYKNAYFQRLKEVIDNDHPVLGVYLGDDLFDEMVEGYVNQFPSHYTSLRNYADNLPLFLAQQVPFSNHPILRELAYFERLLLTAFDAADVETFTLSDLQAVAEHQWPTLVFRFQPSVQLAKFQWNSVESWQALKSEQTPAPAIAGKNHWLLWRNSERLTEFRSLSTEELMLMTMILEGNNFSALCEYLLTSSDKNNVTELALNYLASWIEQGLFHKPNDLK